MKNLKKPLIFTLCLIPIAAVGGWFSFQMSLPSIDEKALEDAIRQAGSREMFYFLNVLITVVYAVVCGFFGYIISDKLGLIRPFRLEKKATLIAAASGAAGLMFIVDAFTFAKWIPELENSYESSKTFDANTWIASILYGGVIEEVMLRLFVMSLLALIGWKLFAKKEDAVPEKILIISNVITAALFAAGHLPSTVMLFGKLTPMLIFRCFLLNGVFGIVFGRLFRKYGIQYAMMAHMLGHIVGKTILLIIL